MMKKFYEAPIAEELNVDAANLMFTSAEGDGAGSDIEWNEDLLA